MYGVSRVHNEIYCRYSSRRRFKSLLPAGMAARGKELPPETSVASWRAPALSETEQIVLIQTLLSFVDDITKGGNPPGPKMIQGRLRRFAEQAQQKLGQPAI